MRVPVISLLGGRALLGLLVCAGACGDEASPPVSPSNLPDASATAVARLDIPFERLSLLFDTPFPMPVAAYAASGETMPLPALSFVSRNPAFVAVDSAGVVTGKTLGGGAWIVVQATIGARTLADSVLITVLCTSDLRADITPGEVTLAPGDTVTLRGRLLGCLGRLVLTDTLAWTSRDTLVARVDAATGLVTAQGPGTTTVGFQGRQYHFGTGVVVTVR